MEAAAGRATGVTGGVRVGASRAGAGGAPTAADKETRADRAAWLGHRCVTSRWGENGPGAPDPSSSPLSSRPQRHRAISEDDCCHPSADSEEPLVFLSYWTISAFVGAVSVAAFLAGAIISVDEELAEATRVKCYAMSKLGMS